jgi:AcrR family transcriptional regulator
MMTTVKPPRRRDPESTRANILDAAQTCLARDGVDQLSMSAVAKLAGVNRGSAYQHFQSREELLAATVERVSYQLLDAAFGEIEDKIVSMADAAVPLYSELPEVVRGMIEFNFRLALFICNNTEISRIWLYQILGSENPTSDPFYSRYLSGLKAFVASPACQENIDPEVFAATMLSGYFLWPVWTRASVKSPIEQRKLAKRYAKEMTRLNLYGVIKVEQKVAFDDVLMHI